VAALDGLGDDNWAGRSSGLGTASRGAGRRAGRRTSRRASRGGSGRTGRGAVYVSSALNALSISKTRIVTDKRVGLGQAGPGPRCRAAESIHEGYSKE
jgi:hypothetical protein